MSSRRTEIEAKKAKLAELRRLREQKSSSQTSRTQSPSLNTPSADSPGSPSHQSIDELVDSLVGPNSKYALPNEATDFTNSSTEPDLVNQLYTSHFSTTQTTPTTVPIPKEIIQYNKLIQTDEWIPELKEREQNEQEEDHGIPAPSVEQLRQQLRREVEAQIEQVHEQEKNQSLPKIVDPRDLDDSKIAELDQFLDQSLKVVTRALDDDYDILVDYGTKTEQIIYNDNPLIEALQLSSDISSDRAVTGIDWSRKYPELIAISYTEKSGDRYAPKGLIIIWNLHAKTRPEYIFNASSDIICVRFSPYHPNLVFGASYNGQILTWDMTAHSTLPILASPLSGLGHSHPVYSLEITGTHNASSLITASTDGTVCTWTTDVLAKPQDKILLTSPALTRNDDIAPTKLAIPSTDPSRLLVGTESGNIHQCNRFDTAASRAGIDPRGYYQGHVAPVTSLDFHGSKGSTDLSQYLLSASLDWSIKLWRAGTLTGPIPNDSDRSLGESVSPILDLTREDAVYDLSWNPHIPGVFANVEGSGYLEVWDLTKDIEVPIAREKPSSHDKRNAGVQSKLTESDLSRPLNRLAWDPQTGSRIAVGGLDGVITIFELEGLTNDENQWNKAKFSLDNLK